MNSGKKWVFMTLGLFFIAGIFAGILIDRELIPSESGKRWDKSKKCSKETMLDRLTKDLSLSDKQRETVSKILEKHKLDFDTMRKELKSNFSKLHDEIDKEILEILTDEQKKKFEKYIEERKKRYTERKESDKPCKK